MKPQPPLLLLGTGTNGQLVLSGSAFQQHKVISGISGSGKSTLLAWIALSLLRQGVAFSLIDPHGDLCRLILQLLLQSDFFTLPQAFERLWFMDFQRTDAAIPFNVLASPSIDSHSIATNVLEALHRAFPSSGTTAALDNTFLAAVYVLAENKRPLTDLQPLLLDASFRQSLLATITDPLVVQFFARNLAEKANSAVIESTLRRSFLLTFSPQLRNTLGQRENMLNFSTLMDRGISCLFSLGGLDDHSKRLLGCLLMVGLEQAFLRRASLAPEKRRPYHVIVDEFPLFSASGESFSIILEQVRKYAGTLYLAHQTQSQLSTSIAGSLGNAIAIIMKAAPADSSDLVSRFYRPSGAKDAGWFNFFSSSPDVFASVRTTGEARLLFEQLKRQEAIVSLNGNVQKIMTPTLPLGKTDESNLTALEAMYARTLLIPLTSKGDRPVKRQLVVVSSEIIPSRRPALLSEGAVSLVLRTGALEHDLTQSLYHFHYLTLAQITKLLGKESSVNYVRGKLKQLAQQDVVETTTLARSTLGKPPTVYYLTVSARRQLALALRQSGSPSSGAKHGYLEHTLACNEILLAAVLLPIIDPSYMLYDLKHERTLKASPLHVGTALLVPDGYVMLGQGHHVQHLYFEIDRNTEEKEKIQHKIHNYTAFAASTQGISVAFCVTCGSEKRVTQLLSWIEQALENNRGATSLFLCADVSLAESDPRSLFTAASWQMPHSTITQSLLMQP